MPCTTLLVGKAATYDGSTIVARNEDSPGGSFEPKRLAVVQPSEQPRRYKSVLSHVEIDLPEDPMRYTSLPNALTAEGIWGEAGVNTANVTMSATETLTSNERVLGADPLVTLRPAKGKPGDADYVPEIPGGIGEEDMLTIVLPYIRTAREGVERLGELLERYGTYEMNGIAFADLDEIWWLETVGGHHWIAKRVPDDAYVVMPNQLGIDAFDLDDALGQGRDHLCSADLRSFIEQNHLDLRLTEDAPFNPRDAFGSHGDADHVYNTPRSWAVQRFLNPHAQEWDDPRMRRGARDAYGPQDDDIPWARIPERKVTIEDVKYALSLHYQGTPYDPYGSGPHAGSFRPIGINRNSQLSIVQLRPYAPSATRALQWVAYASNAFNAAVPLYANVDAAPAYLEDTTERVTSENLYWASRLVGALASASYHSSLIHLERYQQKVVARAYEILGATDSEVARQNLDYAQATPALQQANEAIARMLKEETDQLLGQVLREASLAMRNSFSRSDG